MRRVLVVGIAMLFLLVGAGVARADHTHVLILPNGNCAILAEAGNEKYQILPDVLFANNPNVDADDAAGGLDGLPLNRRQDLVLLVPRRGEDRAVAVGQDQHMGVIGSGHARTREQEQHGDANDQHSSHR